MSETNKGPTFGTIALADIIVDKGFNIRQDFDREGLDLLGRSLAADGQDEPITVNQTGDEQYHLIDGERRYRAAREAGLETVQCQIYQDLDTLTAMKKHLRSDVHKKNLGPIEQAIGMQRLGEHGMTIKQVAEFFGKSEDTVRRRLGLLGLPGEVQKMITRTHHPLPIRQAEYLIGLSTSEALRIARQAAPSVGPVASEEEVKVLVDAVKKGPDLPEVEPVRPAGRAERRKKKQEQARRGLDQKLKAARTPAPKGAADLKPIAVKCGITGRMKIKADGQILIAGAMLTVNADGKIATVKLAELGLELLESDAMKQIAGVLKKATAAADKKKTNKTK